MFLDYGLADGTPTANFVLPFKCDNVKTSMEGIFCLGTNIELSIDCDFKQSRNLSSECRASTFGHIPRTYHIC